VKDFILSKGLRKVPISRTEVTDFETLRSSGVDLDKVRLALPEDSDPETAAVIDLLREG
jgi:hypothetical protein